MSHFYIFTGFMFSRTLMMPAVMMTSLSRTAFITQDFIPTGNTTLTDSVLQPAARLTQKKFDPYNQ